MAVQKLNDVLLGIVASFNTRGVNNNYMVNAKGNVLKSAGKEIYLWNDDMYHAPLDQFFCFQPFNELVTHDDSPALSYLRRMICMELNSILMQAVPALLGAAISIKAPNKRQSRLIDGLTKVDAKTIEYAGRLFEEVKLFHRTRSVVDITLHTSHPLTREPDGQKYACLRSPLLQAMNDWVPKAKLFGITGPTKVEMEFLRTALRLLLPEDWEQGCYFVGNKHSVIPRNKALHDIYSDMLDHINEVLTTLKVTSVDMPEIHDDWTDGLHRVANLLQGVPRDIFGTIGEARQGVDAAASTEAPRRIQGEGFGSSPVTTSQTNVPQGGLMGLMHQSQQPAMFGGAMTPPPGYVLVPAGNFGQPQFNGAHGQGGNVNDASVPQGGLMGLMQNSH